MKVSLESQLTLYPLSITKDQKNYIVEEPISGEFFEMPLICIDAIERFQKDETVGAVEEALKDQYPEEKVDMLEFVGQLLELGLVQEVDGLRVEGEKEKQKAASKKASGFLFIPVWVGRLFFNRIMNKVYLFLLFLNILILVLNPSFFPHYQDIFLFDSMILNIVTYLLISLVFILVHEFGHVIAIRAHDLPAKLSIGNRLIFIVFETDLTSAWKLAPKQRNTLYFAGMSFEQVILFLTFCVMLLFPDINLIGFLGIIVFDIFIKTLFQCCFYMKTDMYYIVENLTGSYNLMENAKAYLRSLFRKDGDSKKGNQQMFQGEEKVVRMYSMFYIAGVLLTFLLFIMYFLPQMYWMVRGVF